MLIKQYTSFVLDDLKFIHQRDGQDALGIVEKQWQQLGHEFTVAGGKLQFTGIENVVHGGMGGSALAALLVKSWPGCNVPFEVTRQYKIPQYVSSKTLFIASSYSGNTEETLSALAEAEAKGAQIVATSKGGRLQEIAAQKNYPYLQLPDCGQPRYAVLASLKALAVILEAANLSGEAQAADSMKQAAKFLQFATNVWLPTAPTAKNPAKKLALELAGKAPVIYAGPLLAPTAYKWKINFNENAKNLAWNGEIPESNHNELMGWSYPNQKPYGIVEIRSKLEHPQVQKRFAVSERLLSGMRPAPNVVEVQGSSLLEQILWSINFGDFVSIYLALLNNVNPTPVDLNDKFKQALTE